MIGGQASLRHITARHLLSETESWPVPQPIVRDVIAHVCEQIAQGLLSSELPAVAAETDAGIGYVSAVAQRAADFASSLG